MVRFSRGSRIRFHNNPVLINYPVITSTYLLSCFKLSSCMLCLEGIILTHDACVYACNERGRERGGEGGTEGGGRGGACN